MVLVILNDIRFEALKFETRTMPTPDMKGKEMIYWIRVETADKRLATELQRFLGSSTRLIELHVPSAFIAVRTELESYNPQPIESAHVKDSSSNLGQSVQQEAENEEKKYTLEIVLRRMLPETKKGQIQPPYG